MERDKNIDYIRGFAMLQVILVHVLYWTGLFGEGYISVIKSFFLFEMPLFFFVTGALSRNRTISNPIRFVLHRVSRIIIPYWIFAALNICVIIGKGVLRDTITFSYAVKAAISWLIPCDRQYSSFSCSTWALWFIPVYILCIVLLPLVLTIHKRKCGKLIFPALVALVVLFQHLGLGLPQKVCFYMIWICLGFYYDDIRAYLTSGFKYICVISTCCAALVILYLCGFSMNMQSNKFPPNLIFMLFSIGAVTTVLKFIFYNGAFIEKLHQHRILSFLLREYEMHSLSIFLYQPIVFYVLITLFNRVRSYVGGNDYIYAVLYLIIAIPACAMIGKLFSRFEGIKIGKGI